MHNIDIDQITKTLAVEMTARTGELWRATTDINQWNRIESPSACLLLREDWRTRRLRIHASAPAKMREKTTGETITCDPNRTAEAIARDIENRLLQHARAHLVESIEWDAEQTREKNAQQLRGKMVKKHLPNEANGKFYSDSKADKYRPRVWAELTYGKMVNIEVNLPLAEALQLLKQLTKGK